MNAAFYFSASSFFELAAKLRDIDTMLRGLVPADENDGNVPTVEFLQSHIFVNVYLPQGGAEFAQ